MDQDSTAQERRRPFWAQAKAWLLVTAVLLNPFAASQLATQRGRIEPPIRYALLWLGWLAGLVGLYLVLYQRVQVLASLRQHWKSYLLLAASTAFALALAELALPLAEEQLKSRRFHVDNYEFSFDVRLNSLGFRDREFVREKSADVRRILFLGDSFVYGVGVDEENALPRRLETLLNQATERRHEVFNLGAPGANPTDYAEIARRFAGYDPDLVLLAFYVDNDVNVGRQAPSGIRRLALWRLLERASNKLFAEADYTWARTYDVDPFYREKAVHGEINPLLFVRAASFPHQQAYYDHVVERFESNAAVRRTLLEVRHAFAGTPLLVVIVPSKYQISPHYIPELEKIGFRFRDGRVVGNGIQQALKRFFEANGIAYLDLMPVLRTARQQTGHDHYFAIDDHFNAFGYQVAAEAASSRVLEMLEDSAE